MKTMMAVLAMMLASAASAREPGILRYDESRAACLSASVLLGIGIQCAPYGWTSGEFQWVRWGPSGLVALCTQEVRGGPLFCHHDECRQSPDGKGWDCW